MVERNRPWSLISEDDAALLRRELLRRAASKYEQACFWREAAECWAELGDASRAGALYARGGDLGRAARTWLQAGCYHEALSAYQQWEQQLSQGNMLNRLQTLLGLSACHLLGTRRSSLPANSDLSEAAGQWAYQQARELLAHAIESTSITASYWEVLGDYGGWLGRYDLVQEGYEQALKALESEGERTQLERICRAYLAQARAHADQLLCQMLEERLAAWPIDVRSSIIAPFPTEQLRLRWTLTGHTGGVQGVAISPDGRFLVSGSGCIDGTIKVWDLSTGKEVRILTGSVYGIYSVAISPDGQTLVGASGDERTIKVWNLSTGKEVRTLAGHTDWVWEVAISPDGQTVVSTSDDKTVKVWDLSTGREVRTIASYARGIVISSDGQTLVGASGGVGTIKVWNLSTGEEVRTFTGRRDWIHSLAINPDGRTLVSGGGLDDRMVKVWNLSTGEEVHALIGHTGRVLALAISPDGRTIVSGSDDKTVKVWNLSTGELARNLTGHTDAVYSVAISPDGQTLVSASADKTIKVWGV